MKLSVAIITFNEEENIKRTLDAVSSIANEIVIVDSFSTDKTKEIACSYDKVVFIENTFNGFGKQKKLAIDSCKNDWILLLDADEQISKELANTIVKLVHEEAKFNAYQLRFVSVINHKPIKFGGWSSYYRLRLFNKNTGYQNEDDVHEAWITNEAIGTIKAPIYHYLYKNIEHQINKLNSYTTQKANVDFKNGKRVWLIKVLLVPFFHFFKMYILRLGFLDGLTGFYLAVSNYFYAFLKYYKLYNIQKDNKANSL